MPNPVLRTSAELVDGVIRCWNHLVWCPGCDDVHGIWSAHPEGTNTGTLWSWDGHAESPTFEPSILVIGGSAGVVCHSFLRSGVWTFLGDSTHPLARQRVPMVPLPDWLVREPEVGS